MMIIGPGHTARNRTVLPFARPRSRGSAQATPLDDLGPRQDRQGELAARMAREADLVGLAADGENLLDDMESTPERDPFSFAKRATEAFTVFAAERFGPIKDPARRASAFRKLAPLQAQFEARAAEMQRDAEEVARPSSQRRKACWRQPDAIRIASSPSLSVCSTLPNKRPWHGTGNWMSNVPWPRAPCARAKKACLGRALTL